MGISHGCLLWVEGGVSPSELEPLVKEHLASLGRFGASVRIEHGHGATIVASAPPDRSFWFENAEVFAQAAAEVAKALGRQTWAIAGYTGSADEWWAWSFERTGAPRWRKRGSFLVLKTLARELKLPGTSFPLNLDIKPFLGRSATTWKVAATVTLEPAEMKWVPVAAAEARRWTGVPHGTQPVWRRDVPPGPHGPLEVAQFVVALTDEAPATSKPVPWWTPRGPVTPSRALSRRGLTCASAWSPAEVFFQGDEVISLPDGTTTRTGVGDAHRSLSGLHATRDGTEVFCRWGNLCVSSSGAHWLLFFVIRAPPRSSLARDALAAAVEARAERALAEQRSRVAASVKKAIRLDDDKAIRVALRAVSKNVRIDIVLEVLDLAGRKPKAFEALAQQLPEQRPSSGFARPDLIACRQDARNRLLEKLPWKQAVARGAQLDAVLSDGQTLLMRAKTPAAIHVLLEAGARPGARDHEGLTALHRVTTADQVRAFAAAGASFEVKSADGEYPFERWLESIHSARRSEKDLDVCRAFIEAKAPPVGSALRRRLGTWKKKPHLRDAAGQLEQWLAERDA